MDGGYETTKQQAERGKKEYFTPKLLGACYDIFYRWPLDSKDKKRLKTTKDIDKNYLVKFLGKFLHYASAHLPNKRSLYCRNKHLF